VKLVRRAIPKKAVKALIEYCNKFGDRVGRSGAEVFEDYLRWMKKHADFFFSSNWPPKLVPTAETWLSHEECEFIDGSAGYQEEIERFTVALLRRNLSLEGFKAEYFDSEFEFYGRVFCRDCAVPQAMYLREYLQKLRERAEWLEGKLKSEDSDFWLSLQETYNDPKQVRHDKMVAVELEFMEKEGEAEGKTCTARNKYLCPYGAEALMLVRIGSAVRFAWKLVKFYDEHWNGSSTVTPSADEAEWYHFDEPGILDVTSYDDILRAFDDGRIEKIRDEYVEFRNAQKKDNRK
jgi:hypothetical protein